MKSRRAFLQSSAALAVTLATRNLDGTQQRVPTSVPKVSFGDYEISRLVVGSNQFYGYSHFNGILDEVMREWNTPDRVCQTLRHCEQNGINAYQFSNSERSASDMERYRAMGGKMHVIGVNFAKSPVEEVVRKLRPIALYHHGEVTDVLFREGKMHEVQEYTKRLRQAGVLVGVGTHKPEVVEYVEERGWDVDFYLLCAYNRTRTREEIRKILGVLPASPKEVYLESDPPRAFAVARQTEKTCFLFKILAAGRLSDRMDRRYVIAAMSFLAGVTGLALTLFGGRSMTLAIVLFAIIGEEEEQ